MPFKYFAPFILLVISLLLWEQPAHAYLDPGSASYLFQIILGTALAATLACGKFLVRFKSGITRALSNLSGKGKEK